MNPTRLPYWDRLAPTVQLAILTAYVDTQQTSPTPPVVPITSLAPVNAPRRQPKHRRKVTTPARIIANTAKWRILAALHHGPASAAALADPANVTPQRRDQALAALARDQHVTTTNGRYTITPAGMAAYRAARHDPRLLAHIARIRPDNRRHD